MNLIRSRKRVTDHGEVSTPAWVVEVMLDLVKDEAERIDARFFDPACGSGNFLLLILQRTLAAVEIKFANSIFNKRHHSLLSVKRTYSIELLQDNIDWCRANLLATFADYLKLAPEDAVEQKFKTPSRPCKLDPYADRLSAWLLAHTQKSRKERRNVKRMYGDLVKLGCDGSHERVAALAHGCRAGTPCRANNRARYVCIFDVPTRRSVPVRLVLRLGHDWWRTRQTTSCAHQALAQSHSFVRA